MMVMIVPLDHSALHGQMMMMMIVLIMIVMTMRTLPTCALFGKKRCEDGDHSGCSYSPEKNPLPAIPAFLSYSSYSKPKANMMEYISYVWIHTHTNFV